MLYWTQRSPLPHAPYFLFIFITKWYFPQDSQWILLLYSKLVILEDDYETNLHFIFVWTAE